MTDDPYAVLGVPPASDDVAIRAAYLALMRRYHPDRNASPEAVVQAQAVIAAFAVLGDREKRMRHDWARRRAAEAAAGKGRRWRPLVTARGTAIPLIVMLALISFVALRAHLARQDPRAPAIVERVDRVAPVPEVAPEVVPVPPVAVAVAEPVIPDTYPIYEQPNAPPPVLAVPANIPARPRLAAAAPPVARKVAPVRTDPPKLAARIVRPADPAPAARERPAPRTIAAVRRPPVAPPRVPAAKVAAAPAAKSDNIIALERNSSAFYNQSVRYGQGAKRVALLSSRNIYFARREACRTEACLRGVHLSHVRDINAIMQGTPAPSAP